MAEWYPHLSPCTIHQYSQQGEMPTSVKHKAVLVDGKIGFMAMKWILKMDHKGCTMVFVRRIVSEDMKIIIFSDI